MKLFSLDLGNSRLKVAQAGNDGQGVIVPNSLGELTTPSVVYFSDDGAPVVGSEALNMALVEPDKVVRNWKRYMGAEKVLYQAPGGTEYRARDIAGLLIANTVQAIEQRTGEVVTEMTITVPANYTEKQKAETIEAAESAGVKVLCLPTEPVAAAFGNNVHERGDGLTLVFDLGGGTFDVSVLKASGNLVEVLRTNGDPELGGQDVNRRIREHVVRMFEQEHGYIPDAAKSTVFYADLEDRIEQLKTTLTTRESANIVVRDGDRLLNHKITRKEVESLIADLVKRALVLVEQTLQEASIGWNEIATILAVGGGSRMPVIGQELELLSGKKLAQKVEPDYAAALGGITAARIELKRQNRSAESETGALPPIDFFSREVTSHPLGVSALNKQSESVQHVMLPNGTPYPSTQVRTFATAEPNQTAVHIVVLEGDAFMAEAKCVKLGEFHLDSIPAFPDITERIEITFQLDINGLLSATARDLKSGKMADMKIEYKSNNHGT